MNIRKAVITEHNRPSVDTQHIPPNKHSRTISLNAHYMEIFKNIRDALKMKYMKYQRSSYKGTTHKHYGYLSNDLKSDKSDLLRLRTDIFPGKVYIRLRPQNLQTTDGKL